uniref:BESS domain-containing protein n=1 Tax=Timema bartmani TaxID=61472 RepID=A0A7R9F0M8_9NEOP|nr:unnamed protein product [Timema bartmani]
MSSRSLVAGGGGSVRQPTPSSGVKLAGEDFNKDKMYEPKHTKRLVRVLTVVAYVFSVSLAAIMLSVYYVFLWNPRDARHPRLPPPTPPTCQPAQVISMYDNYSTEVGMRKEALQRLHLHGRRVVNHLVKTTFNRADWNLNPNLQQPARTTSASSVEDAEEQSAEDEVESQTDLGPNQLTERSKPTQNNQKSPVRNNTCELEFQLSQFMTLHKERQKDDPDKDDRAFFESLLPSLKSLDTDEKLNFRIHQLTLSLVNNRRAVFFTPSSHPAVLI